MKFVKKVLLAALVLLSAFAEGKLKPYDYKVEYLESTGEQYVNTGLYFEKSATASPIIETTIQFVSWSDASQRFMGAQNGSQFFQAYLQDGNSIHFQPLPSLQRLYSASVGISDYKNILKIRCEYYGPNFHFELKEGLTRRDGFCDGPDIQRIQYPILLFDCNTANGARHSNTKIRFYQFSYNDGNKLIDLIPVVKSGEGMMYDKMSGKLFRNAGTGAFIVGPRKADSAVEIAMGDVGEVPPLGYRRVKSLVGNTTAYLTVNWAGSTDYQRMYFDIPYGEYPSYVCGNHSGDLFTFKNSMVAYVHYSNNMSVVIPTPNSTMPWNSNGYLGNQYPITLDVEHSTENVRILKNGLPFYETTDMTKFSNKFSRIPFLFAIASYGWDPKTNQKQIQIARAKYWNKKGNLYSDLIPVVRNYDNQPGMWDLVRKQFYTNSNTVGDDFTWTEL